MARFKFGGAFSNTLLPQSQSTLLLKELIKMMAYFSSKIIWEIKKQKHQKQRHTTVSGNKLVATDIDIG